jgi:hypothetical protein
MSQSGFSNEENRKRRFLNHSAVAVLVHKHRTANDGHDKDREAALFTGPSLLLTTLASLPMNCTFEVGVEIFQCHDTMPIGMAIISPCWAQWIQTTRTETTFDGTGLVLLGRFWNRGNESSLSSNFSRETSCLLTGVGVIAQ